VSVRVLMCVCVCVCVNNSHCEQEANKKHVPGKNKIVGMNTIKMNAKESVGSSRV
jgi:hypothetical protein